MPEQQQEEPEEERVITSTRLGMTDFLMQLDVAEAWMLWVNPDLDEMELIVKEGDGDPKIFHGPDPVDVPFDQYKEFCRQVEEMSDKKE